MLRINIMFVLFSAVAARPVYANMNSDLLTAATKGRTDTVRILLNKGANINVQNKTGNTPLMLTTERNHLATAQTLLDNGADANVQNKYEWTALMWAAGYRRTAILKAIITHGADMELKNEDGKTALIWATERGHSDMVKILLDNGADINAKDVNGKTALIWAAMEGHPLTTRILLDYGSDINQKDNSNRTALKWAEKNNRLITKRVLLNKSLNKQTTDKKAEPAPETPVPKPEKKRPPVKIKKTTPERSAVAPVRDDKHKTASIVRKEKSRPADIQPLPDIDTMADIKGGGNIVKTEKPSVKIDESRRNDSADLLDRQKAGRATNQKKKPSLLVKSFNYIRSGKRKNVSFALLAGTLIIVIGLLIMKRRKSYSTNWNFNAKDKHDLSILMQAAKRGNTDFMEELLAYGVDVNAISKDGNTALINAALNGHTSTVNTLLENDADLDLRNNNGRTALMAAALGGNPETLKAILDKGTDINVLNAKDNDGITAIVFAANKGYKEITELLKEAGARF